MRFDTPNGDINIRLKYEKRDAWVGVYWDYRRSIESRYRCLDIYICLVPLFPIHIRKEWGWKHRDTEYDAYCQQMWARQSAPLDYREWKYNRNKYGSEP